MNQQDRQPDFDSFINGDIERFAYRGYVLCNYSKNPSIGDIDNDVLIFEDIASVPDSVMLTGKYFLEQDALKYTDDYFNLLEGFPSHSALFFTAKSSIHHIDVVVDKIFKFVDCVTEIKGEEERFRLFLLLRELMTNAVLHGNKEHIESRIRIAILMVSEKHELVIVVGDEGNGFDLNQMMDMIKHEDDLREHHRGLLIVRSLSSRMYNKKNSMIVHFTLRR
ncbi:MAG: ATP-binding protein [Candidatus Cloacimonetes bacterium]|nr:ATP-binding protein [Candidatus Cloacimonadota bacterium]